MADQGAAILVIVGQTKICVSAVLGKINLNIIEIDYTKTSDALWEAFRAKLCQNSAFGRVDFWEHIKSMESNTNMKFTH